MIGRSAAEELARLAKLYQKNWGKAVDFAKIPPHIPPDALCPVLRRIAVTGESVLEGYAWVRKAVLEYDGGIDWSLRYESGSLLEKPCPFCGKPVRIDLYGSYGQSAVIRCATENCLSISCRGL